MSASMTSGRPLRIGIATWSASVGAFGAIASDLAWGFLQEDVRVDVASVDRAPLRDKVAGHPGVQHLYMGKRSSTSVGPLRSYLTREQPDALISLSWLLNSPAVVARLLSGWKGLLLLSEQAHIGYEATVEHRADLRLRFIPVMARRLYPHAHAITAPSQSALRDAVEFLGLEGDTIEQTAIPNPVDTAEIRLRGAEPITLPWHPSDRRPLLVCVGRLARQKGHSLLIRAFSDLIRECQCRLLILGEGPMRASLEEQISSLGLHDHVKLPGAVPNPHAYVAQADVFVLPSEKEGFGLVVVEALAQGCPVVATDCGGPSEILGEGTYGIVTPRGSVPALRDAIGKLLDNPTERARLAFAGQKRAEEYRPERVARRWISLISALLQARQQNRPKTDAIFVRGWRAGR